MAGGPLYPSSAVPDTSGETFPSIHTGATNSRRTEGLGLAASIASDRTWELRFDLPPSSLPSGTLKLQILSLSSAVTGTVVVEPQWFSATPDVDTPDDETLALEGDTTITWATGDDDELKLTKITLDAGTAPVAGDTLVLHLKFDSTSTLAVVSTHRVSLIWE